MNLDLELNLMFVVNCGDHFLPTIARPAQPCLTVHHFSFTTLLLPRQCTTSPGGRGFTHTGDSKADFVPIQLQSWFVDSRCEHVTQCLCFRSSFNAVGVTVNPMFASLPNLFLVPCPV
ncbi:hypothetical protein FQA47_020652 [Oryzias melastigma]|uniref:Uncharacterized protein n=1 Tax=Oryzias melastigma TaxID=30732 RepID=A0A834CB83_ORYME|nr:hypothetical protein FQA47_020652 [Oryzias melastigma]